VVGRQEDHRGWPDSYDRRIFPQDAQKAVQQGRSE